MPKTVKVTPEKEKNIFQRAFDRLPEGLKNFIRTIRDVAFSITNRVIFGNRQAERLRKADVDEILRKEKEEREQLGSDDKDTPKDNKEKDTKETKEEIEELPETEEYLTGIASIEDLDKLSDDLWEKNIPHKLTNVDEGVPCIEYEYNEGNGMIKIELIENASDIQETDVIRFANDNDAIVRLVNGDKTHIVSATAAYMALGRTLEKEQSFLEAKRELYVGLQEKLLDYNPTVVIAERGEVHTLHTNYHNGSEISELNQGNPLYISLHYENKDYVTPYSSISIENARDVIEKGEAPLYKIGDDVFQEEELFEKIADAKNDFEQTEPELTKEFQFYAEHGDWAHILEDEIVFANKSSIETLHQELSDAGVPHELKDADTDSPYISCLDKDGSELAQIKLVSQETQLNKSDIIYAKEGNEEVVTVIGGGDTLYASISTVSEELVTTQQRQEFVKNLFSPKETEENIETATPDESTVDTEKSEQRENSTESKEEKTSSSQHDNTYAQAEAEASAQVNTIIVYNAEAYGKALDNAKKTGQNLDIKLADTSFVVSVREGKPDREVRFKPKNEKSEKQFNDVIRSKAQVFLEGKENSVAIAHGDLQIDMKCDANVAIVSVTKGDKTQEMFVSSNESPEQLNEQIQGAIKRIELDESLDEPEDFNFEDDAPSEARKTLDEMIEDAGEVANGQDYVYVIPDEANLDEDNLDPRYY